MPTSEVANAAIGNPVVLLAACILAGLAVGLLLYVGGLSMRGRAVPVTAGIGEAQRRARRRRAAPEDPLIRLAMSAMPVIVPVIRKLPLDFVRASLAQRYAQAGWPGGLDDDDVFGLSLLAGVVLAVLAAVTLLAVAPAFAPAGLLGVLLGPALASGVLSNTRKKREMSISQTMPYVLDLLVLTMRAGAALTAAIERVAEDFGREPIGVEFKALLTDIETGIPMGQALERLARRVPVPLIRTFADDVIQSQELGRPIADTLARLCDRARTRRVQDAVEAAGKAKVMVLIPGMLILLASLLILFSPFIVRAFYQGYGAG